MAWLHECFNLLHEQKAVNVVKLDWSLCDLHSPNPDCASVNKRLLVLYVSYKLQSNQTGWFLLNVGFDGWSVSNRNTLCFPWIGKEQLGVKVKGKGSDKGEI